MARGYLFSEGELRDALESHARGMDAEIAKAPEEHLMQVDEDEWVAALVERYRIEAPELKRDDWWMDAPTEIKVDVRGDSSRAIFDDSSPVLVDGFRVVVHIPFSGKADVFRFRPSTFNWNPPIAEIHDGEARLVIEYPADAPRDVKAEAEGVLSRVEAFLGWARSDVEAFNAGLEQRARRAIQGRRSRVREAYDWLQETGIPMRKGDETAKTYIADVLVRLPSPSIPLASASTSIALEPVLSDTVFEHILKVIRGGV
jgi:hypothetical protein